MMTQEKANEIFEGDLGRQLSVIYSTADGRVFIRYEEARKHTLGQLDEGTQPLEDKTIKDWYNTGENSGKVIDVGSTVILTENARTKMGLADGMEYKIEEILTGNYEYPLVLSCEELGGNWKEFFHFDEVILLNDDSPN